RVAFTVSELGRLLPSDTSLEFSAEFSSVVAYGECEIVDERAEATWALEAMLVKYAPHLRMGDDYRAPVPEELERTTVLRIRVDRWAGKHKEVEADFPGAYRYEDVVAG
ncbi:MAG: pyridoxamine 5'-phosphate oxidase family protein, partial [Gemmatimonadota bacterium]